MGMTMIQYLILSSVLFLCRTLRTSESHHSSVLKDDHQCSDPLDRLFKLARPGSQKSLYAFDTIQYKSALEEAAPNYEKVLEPGDCEVIVVVKGNRMHTRKTGKKVCHPHVVSNFRKLLGHLREEFPDEDLPNVVVHMQTPDTMSGCGTGRPEVVCLSSSYAQTCVHSLNLPIHFNQDLSTTEKFIPEYERIRSGAKAFQDKQPKAVWHGVNSGHAPVQKEIQDAITLAGQSPKSDAYDGERTMRDIAVQLASEKPDVLNASWEKMPMAEWTEFQAWLSPDGNSFAGNTLEALLSGSIMMRHPPIVSYQWFEPLLMPWKHYVPIRYDLADVPARVKWMSQVPGDAAKIPPNAVDIGQAIADRKTQLCYVLQALRRLESLQRDLLASLPEMPGDVSEEATTGSFEGRFDPADEDLWNADEDEYWKTRVANISSVDVHLAVL